MTADVQPKRRTSFWRELPVLVVIAVVVAFVVRIFALQTFWIPSESMQPTLEKGDRVLVNKLVYYFRAPHRGEIIVFEAPVPWRGNPQEKDFIKRVIGIGGDRVKCCTDGRLTVNGYPLEEEGYLFRDANGRQDRPSDTPFEITVPQGRLWVMGDHRSRSGDSREQYLNRQQTITQATIPEDAVIGRAFLLFWPLGRMDWLSVPATFDKVPGHP